MALAIQEVVRQQMNQWRPGDPLQLAYWKKCDKFFFMQWYSKNKKDIKAATLISRYGITQQDYNNQFKLQKGRCAICDIEFDSTIKELRPQIDHDHKTKKVRGLLCGPCNKGLGFFKDDPARLIKASSYLFSVIRGLALEK